MILGTSSSFHSAAPDLTGGWDESARTNRSRCVRLCPVPDPALPRHLDGCHVLALTAGWDLQPLAAAWFAGAIWEVAPQPVDPALLTPPSGRARDEYLPPEPRPGRLRLAGAMTMTGPWSLPAGGASGLPDRPLDLYALTRGAADPMVLGWLAAAARRAGGAVVSADRKQVIVPDAAASVDLTLWTGTAYAAPDLVAAARPYLAGARVGQPMAIPGVPAAYTVTAEFQYDGALTIAAQPRDAVPVAVAAVEWGEQGPWTYQVSWVPPDPAELRAAQPSREHLIARTRVVPVVARVLRGLLAAAGGIVVDEGGFPIGDDELAHRSVRR